MNLLVFAHRGEAQEFIHNFKLKACQHQEGLYLSASLSVFISGEGELNVFTRLGQILTRFENLKSVVNMGIAGSLNHKFTLEGIYPIKMIKAYRYDEIEFQTLETQNEKGEELVSTHKRVLDDDFATLLKPYGDIVDREAWAIGLICKKQKIPFYCYKLISDYAGSTTQCFDIKERALYLSNLLYEYYLEQLHTQKKSEELEEIKEITHPLLHISFSQKKEILKHLKSIALTEEKSIQEVWEDLDLYQYHEEENPKKRTKNLIQDLYYRINPHQLKIMQKLEKETKNLRDIGANVHFDPRLEKVGFKLTFEINSKGNINRLKQALDILEFEKIQDVFKGRLDV